MTGVLAASTTGAISPPSIEYSQLAPMLIVFAAAVVGVLVEAFVPRPFRRTVHMVLALGSLVAAFILTIVVAGSKTIFADGSPGHIAAMGAVAVDRPTLFIQGTILVLAFVSVLLIGDTSNSPFVAQAAATPGSPEEREGLVAGIFHTEIFPLTLFAVGGMLLFPAANDLLTMFVALEVLSLPLYLLCGLARRRRLLSHEAAMKYFLLGAFSSAFFLFGIAMLYGFSGSVSLSAIASEAASNTANSTLLYAGIALLGVGLLFKIGAVPFHSWKPDVYQGAPTPVTALMASCTVVSAFGALLRVFFVAFGNLTWDWRPALWVIAVLTMVVGAVIAITQTDVKRLLAYSSIAHAGFILPAVIATSAAGLSGALFYLAAYGLTTIGAFAVITLVRDTGRRGRPPVPVGGPGPPVAAGRRHLRAVPARLRRHPADQRLHRKVRGLPGRDRRGRNTTRDRRRAGQLDRRLLLRPRDRAHVLQRPDPRRPGSDSAERVHRNRGGDRRRGDYRARHRARTGPELGESCGQQPVRQLGRDRGA